MIMNNNYVLCNNYANAVRGFRMELKSAVSSALLLLPVFNTQLVNSELHTFALRHPVFCHRRVWVDGRNVGITIQYSSISVHARSMYIILQTWTVSISYCTHTRAITDIVDRRKVVLSKQRSRAQPEIVQG